MSVQISKDCTRPLVISKDEVKEKIAELVGLNKTTVQNIKAKIDDYGSPLPHKQIGQPLKINERTERHLKRIIREDPFASFKEINVELTKLDVFVSIETLRSYVDRLDFKSYRAAHKPRLTARHRKKGSKRGKRVLRKEGERYDERNIISTVKWGGGGAMIWGCFWGEDLGRLEITDTSSVDQETYISILANKNTSHQKYGDYVLLSFEFVQEALNTADRETNSASKEKKRQPPSEVRWVLENMARFDHKTFFNEHLYYTRLQVQRRFSIIVEDWIMDKEKKKQIKDDYDEWLKNEKLVDEFWEQWHVQKAAQNKVDLGNTELLFETGTSVSTSSALTISMIDDYLSRNITPPICEPYLVDGFNVSLGFYNYQMHVKELILNRNLLTFESHPAHILSSGAILEDRLSHLNWGVSEFPSALLDVLKKNYRGLTRKQIDVDTAIHNIVGESLNQSTAIKQSVGVFTRLLRSLPWHTDKQEEHRLCSRYLHGILQGLFDERRTDGEIMFDFTDEQTAEAVNSGADLAKCRPDGSVVFSAGNFSKTLAFVEVKPFTDANDNYKLNADLVRLGIFAKNTIDASHSKNVMIDQAVGMNLTFYMVQKTTAELYTMFELDCLRFPSSIHDMTMIFGLMDKLMDIVQVFRTFL
ncbi:hypothetical protein G6F46_007315 [Rhizopus delemar]|nr:hypothetical protein G6F55_005994 [Rhizopus delemar]KAG1635858.1 hypothetical protein G6F45_001716 [Rhizopus arrhizus]KAG1509962.1 hypothetical protein G6F53_007041 [Rhizopus delemar]KAG1521909.1 hypothetical protein G6F52_006322 [Rhizopus delemar]KAG1568664.1 hypothetical protein G6F50_007085 [Rhizopus delemar]